MRTWFDHLFAAKLFLRCGSLAILGILIAARDGRFFCYRRGMGDARAHSDTQEPASYRPVGRRIRGLDAEQRRELRRRQLLDAAVDLFARNGYANTSIEQVCQTAYVGNKAFYEVFANKEECILGILHEIFEGIQQRMAAALVDASPDVEEITGRLVSAFVHGLLDDRRFAMISFRELGGISQNVEAQRRANRRWGADFLAALWREHGVVAAEVDCHQLAVVVIGGLFDGVADWFFDNSSSTGRDIDDLISDLVNFVNVVRAGIGSDDAGKSPSALRSS